jgi:hypothetical protein
VKLTSKSSNKSNPQKQAGPPKKTPPNTLTFNPSFVSALPSKYSILTFLRIFRSNKASKKIRTTAKTFIYICSSVKKNKVQLFCLFFSFFRDEKALPVYGEEEEPFFVLPKKVEKVATEKVFTEKRSSTRTMPNTGDWCMTMVIFLLLPLI